MIWNKAKAPWIGSIFAKNMLDNGTKICSTASEFIFGFNQKAKENT